MGLDYDVVAASCCGMAGAFGFEAEHYDVSMACGEYALLPTVRGAAKDTLVIADGFSCREQIHQATDRHALHLAEVLHLALHAGGGAAAYPEQPYVEQLRYATNGASGQTPVNGQAGGRRTAWLAAAAFVAGAVLSYAHAKS